MEGVLRTTGFYFDEIEIGARFYTGARTVPRPISSASAT